MAEPHAAEDLRRSIDAVLDRARTVWNRPDDDRDRILIATLDDVSIRVRTTATVAAERARDLASLGWDVEVCEARPNDARPNGAPRGVEISLSPTADQEPPAVPEVALPPVDAVAVERLRTSA